MRCAGEEIQFHPFIDGRPAPRGGQNWIASRAVAERHYERGEADLEQPHGQAHPLEDLKLQFRRQVPP